MLWRIGGKLRKHTHEILITTCSPDFDTCLVIPCVVGSSPLSRPQIYALFGARFDSAQGIITKGLMALARRRSRSKWLRSVRVSRTRRRLQAHCDVRYAYTSGWAAGLKEKVSCPGRSEFRVCRLEAERGRMNNVPLVTYTWSAIAHNTPAARSVAGVRLGLWPG